MDKVYVKDSTIPNAGKGLFASKNIKKGQVVVYFHGKLIKNNNNNKISMDSNNIHFNDDTILQCSTDDIASNVKDPIEFIQTPRKLMESLTIEKTLYKCYPNTKINTQLKLIDKLHKAYLIATRDINKDDEIFCHHGFNYWFIKELENGFKEEKVIEENGFPENITEYPAFKLYLKEFYPDHIHFITHELESKQGHLVKLYFENDNSLTMLIPNFKSKVKENGSLN